MRNFGHVAVVRYLETFGIVGAMELNESAFSSEGLAVTLERTTDGKAKATITSEGSPVSSFFRVQIEE